MAKLIAFLLFVIIGASIGGFCIEYSLEFWLPFITKTTVDVPFVPCMVAGIFVGSPCIPIALVTWVISLVI